jgi:hypothetical protein
MNSVTDYIEFVKKQIEYQDRRAVVTRSDAKKRDFHIEAAHMFRGLLSFLENQSNTPLSTIDVDVDPSGTLVPKELLGLPPELIKELSGGGLDKQEMLIYELIESAGGTLSLDRILIGIYKRSGEIVKRPHLTAKLYRMSQNGKLFRVPQKKGVYTTSPALGGTITSEDEEVEE